jgi:hypothetical protein
VLLVFLCHWGLDDKRIPTLTCNSDGLLDGVDIGTFSFVNLDFTRFVASDKSGWLDDRPNINGTDSTTRQQGGEQEVVAGRDNNLIG